VSRRRTVQKPFNAKDANAAKDSQTIKPKKQFRHFTGPAASRRRTVQKPSTQKTQTPQKIRKR
jgi:hypothetical protein